MEYKNTSQFISDYRDYLQDNGITNTHIAKKMDISPQQLQNVFKKKELTVIDLCKLCNAIGYSCNISITRKEG